MNDFYFHSQWQKTYLLSLSPCFCCPPSPSSPNFPYILSPFPLHFLPPNAPLLSLPILFPFSLFSAHSAFSFQSLPPLSPFVPILSPYPIHVLICAFPISPSCSPFCLPDVSFDHNFLYRRALVLQRFINLVDSVLPHLVPKWEHSIGEWGCQVSSIS